MKHSNPATRKPSLGKINAELTKYTWKKNSNLKYTTNCTQCGKEFSFLEKDLKTQTYTCPYCGREEIFFMCNFM